jgi:hypothetical protein
MPDKKIDTLFECRNWISSFPETLFDKGTRGFEQLNTCNNEQNRFLALFLSYRICGFQQSVLKYGG